MSESMDQFTHVATQLAIDLIQRFEGDQASALFLPCRTAHDWLGKHTRG